MASFEEYMKVVESGIKEIATETLCGFKDEVIQDNIVFFENTKEDFKRWLIQLQTGGLSKEDFEFLVKSKKDLAEMHFLKQKGISAIKIYEFKDKMFDLIVGTAFDMFL